MIAAVTGAAGHVGANLVRALLARGDEVRALVRDDSRSLAGLELQIVQGDILDPAVLKSFVAGADVVYHLAARIALSPKEAREAEAINVTGTENVANAALEAGVRRMIHFSSVHAFECLPGTTVNETSPPATASPAPVYDHTKARGDQVILGAVERGLPAIIVHPSAVLGPHDYKPSAMGQVILDLARGRMPALVDASFDWVDVRDVCSGAIAAFEKGRVGERYLLTGTFAHVREIANAVAKYAGRRAPRIAVPLRVAKLGVPFAGAWSGLTGQRPLFTRDSIRTLQHACRFDRTKAHRELGYTSRPLDETIETAITCYQQRAKLPVREAIPA